MVLGIREFEAVRAELLREGDDVSDTGEVLAVKDAVEGEREAEFSGPFADSHFLFEAFRAGDSIGSRGGGILNRNLNTSQAEFREIT